MRKVRIVRQPARSDGNQTGEEEGYFDEVLNGATSLVALSSGDQRSALTNSNSGSDSEVGRREEEELFQRE